MKTDIKALAEMYKDSAWTGDLAWLKDTADIHVKASTVTEQSSHATITIEMNLKSDPEKPAVSATIAVVESTVRVNNPRPGQDAEKTHMCVMFMNNHSHSIIFSSMSKNALEKSQKYITQYFAKRIGYMLPDNKAKA